MNGAPFEIQVEKIARDFHTVFERYHTSHGNELCAHSKIVWEDVPDDSKALLIAVFKKLVIDDTIQPGSKLNSEQLGEIR